MQPAKLDILVTMFAYGGNGGMASVLPTHATWLTRNVAQMNADERIGRVAVKTAGDIPLTMVRNGVVKQAKAEGFDVILMLDSDNIPDLYLNHRQWAQPFWQTSFDFLYERHVRGLPTVVCAPYCGPPPHPTQGGEENVYVFYPENLESVAAEQQFRIAAYTRSHAAMMRGIQEIACGPTGVILYSTSAFDLMQVGKVSKVEALDQYRQGKITQERALQLLAMESWFFYEYTDKEQTEKASTEDVTNTREIALAGWNKHRQATVFCNWDAWAGHMKPKCVGMPEPIRMEQINEIYREAVQQDLHLGEEYREVDFTGDGVQPTTVDLEVTPPNENTIRGRLIFGHKVDSVGHVTPMSHLQALHNLVEIMAQRNKDRALRVVEVGSWVGESAIALQSGFGPAGGTVFCIDHFRGNAEDWVGRVADERGPQSIKEYFLTNTKPFLGKTIKLIEGSSLEEAEKLDPQEADIVFLDASHDYDSVVFDIEAWERHVSDRGYLIGHDYHDEFPGVKAAVDEFMSSVGLDTRLITGTSIWVCDMNQYRTARRAVLHQEKEEPVAI